MNLVRRTSVSGEPRGPLCGMGTCFECAADGVRTCQPSAAEPVTAHAEVVVVGAGPAGIAAAAVAAEHRRDVLLVDDQPSEGGQIWRGGSGDELAAHWIARLGRQPVRRLYATRIIAADGPRLITQCGGAITGEQIILATGTRERFLPFPGWTLPGVMGAGGVQAMAKSGLDVRGKRVVLGGTGPLLVAVAATLRGLGADIRLIAEQAPAARIREFALGLWRHPSKLAQAVQLRASLLGVPYRYDCWIERAGGDGRLEWVEAGGRRIECDLAGIGYRLVPNTDLHELLAAWPNVIIAPTGDVGAALVEGEIAGLAAAGLAPPEPLEARRRAARRFAASVDEAFALRRELRALCDASTIVCRCEDVRYGSLAPFDGWRAAKLHTRCGMGPCQGRVCGPAVEYLFGWKPDSVRPPLMPAPIAALINEGESH